MMKKTRIFYRTIKYLMWVASLATLFSQVPVRSVNAGSGEMVIQVLRLNIDKEAHDEKQILIAEIVDDFLAQSIEEAAFRQISSYPFIPRSRDRVPRSREQYERFLDRFRAQGVRYLVLPDLKISELGYVLRVATIDLRRDTDRAYFMWHNSLDLDKGIIDGDADFREIEEKIIRVARRVVGRIGAGRALGTRSGSTMKLKSVGRVLFWCANAIDRNDSELAGLGRFLTLQMPFYLADAAERSGETFEFIGLSPKEYYFECLRGVGNEDTISRADVVITADLFRTYDDRIEISFLLSTKEGAPNRPLTVTRFQGELEVEMKRLAELVVSDLNDATSRVVFSPIGALFTVLKNANVRAAPSAQTKVIGRLFESNEVYVVGMAGNTNWYKVRLSDSRDGYVYAPLLLAPGE